MDWLDQLFVLQEQGGKTEFKPFTVVDEQDRERIIPVKIKTPIEYDTDEYDYIDGRLKNLQSGTRGRRCKAL